MEGLISIEEDIRSAFKEVFPTKFNHGGYSIYETDTKYIDLFKKIEKEVTADKRLDSILLTKYRYSVNMRTDKTGEELYHLNKEAWLVPVTIYGSFSYPDQFIRHRVDEGRTDRNISYSNIVECDRFDIYKFNHRKPYAFINSSRKSIELMYLWFKRGSNSGNN